MSGLLVKAGALFLAPADPAATFAPPRARAAVVGVLAEARDLPVVAGAEAASLRRAAGAPFALVCVPELPYGLPALPAASRAAAKLARRDVPARACGALCLVGPDDARAAMTALDAPVVVAASRRGPEVDALLALADRLVLLAGADPLLTELAAEDLARLGPPVTVTVAPAGALARLAARLGLGGRAVVLETT